jgi:predicted component of type VI protein secretion system
MISKIQCMLKFEAGVWKLVDGSKGRVSTNGTWVYIRDECQLRSGMILKAGQMVIRVEVSEVVK